jgi:hypothetical protein
MGTFFASPPKTILLSLLKVQMLSRNAVQVSSFAEFPNINNGLDVVLFPYFLYFKDIPTGG